MAKLLGLSKNVAAYTSDPQKCTTFEGSDKYPMTMKSPSNIGWGQWNDTLFSLFRLADEFGYSNFIYIFKCIQFPCASQIGTNSGCSFKLVTNVIFHVSSFQMRLYGITPTTPLVKAMVSWSQIWGWYYDYVSNFSLI